MATTGKSTTTYLTEKTKRRFLMGDAYLRRCCCIFVISLYADLTAPQYSHRYYLSWVFTYGSFLLLLPSVLPSDNNRVTVMLASALANTVIMGSYCVLMTRRKVRRLDPDCFVTQWNVFFWIFHGIVVFVSALAIAFALCLAPSVALNKFWKIAGSYFIVIGLTSLADELVAAAHRGEDGAMCGGRLEPLPPRVFWWKVSLSLQAFLTGALCLNNRFKLRMWRLAASYGSITVRGTSPYSPSFVSAATRCSASPPYFKSIWTPLPQKTAPYHRIRSPPLTS